VLDPYRLNDGDRSRPVLLPRPSKLLGRHLGIASELLLPPLGLALTLLEGCPPNERPSLARYHAAAEPTLPSLASGEGLLLRPAGSIHTGFMRFAIDAIFPRSRRPGASFGPASRSRRSGVPPK